MTRARYRDVEYDVVNFTDNAEWVLRDAGDNVRAIDDDEVVIRCDDCGQWRRSVLAGDDGRWTCAHSCGQDSGGADW